MRNPACLSFYCTWCICPSEVPPSAQLLTEVALKKEIKLMEAAEADPALI